MSIFFSIANITWKDQLTYRLNFLMWRLRNILRLLIIYFLWTAVYSNAISISGYSKEQMLTYILLTSLISSLVLSSRTQDIADEIISGDLSNILLKPFNIFFYWLAKDFGDKFTNFVFGIFEVSILILLLKPPFFMQTNPLSLFLFLLSTIGAVIIFIQISALISFLGFWTNNVWGPRFLMIILIEFFAGGLFPLDILPSWLFNILSLLPFSFVLFFPIKVYLGTLSPSLLATMYLAVIFWIIFLTFIVREAWKRGLKNYEASGR